MKTPWSSGTGAVVAEYEAEIERLRAELRSERLLWQNAMHAQTLEAEARLAKVVEAVDAILPAAMDALESDSDLSMRRAAFELVQELYEESNPFGAALAAAQPEEFKHRPGCLAVGESETDRAVRIANVGPCECERQHEEKP